jgi:indole-3-glycerol phosphate synthase
MTILERILQTKRDELASAKRSRPLDDIRRQVRDVSPPRDFVAALSRNKRQSIRVIAEIKRASPSAGLIVPEFEPASIARTYAANGAAAISVLTDEAFFGGSLDHLTLVSEQITLPILRKDFTIDEYQLYESRAAGADAVLLIVEALGVERCAAFQPVARGLGMGVIVEVHTEENLRSTLERLGRPIGSNYFLGMNNRDLSVQTTSTNTAIYLSSLLGRESASWIAESGIKDRADVVRAEQAGAEAVLVGEALLRSADPGAKLRELRGL